MTVDQQYSVIYQKHTGKPAQRDGMYLPEFVQAICAQHKAMKDQIESSSPEKIQDSNAYKLYETNTAAMLLELKQICTGIKNPKVNL